ncbi:MAG: LPD38 domain-containing protein, partial [Bacteroidota bacterium]
VEFDVSAIEADEKSRPVDTQAGRGREPEVQAPVKPEDIKLQKSVVGKLQIRLNKFEAKINARMQESLLGGSEAAQNEMFANAREAELQQLAKLQEKYDTESAKLEELYKQESQLKIRKEGKESESLFSGQEFNPSKLTEEGKKFVGGFIESEDILSPKTEKKVKRTEILKFIEETFQIPLRKKLTQHFKKGTMGKYYPFPELVRTRYGDIETITHEIAHHIAKKIKNWSKTVPKNAIAELKKLDYDPEKQRLSEGFAEFVRHLLTTGQAKELAPNFYKYFNDKFKSDNPKTYDDLQKTGILIKTWYEQGAENRVLDMIDFNGEHAKLSIKDKIVSSIHTINKNFFDEFEALQRFETQLKDRGVNLKPSESAFELATFLKQKERAIADTMLRKAMIDQYGNIVGKSLIEILSPITKTRNIKEMFSPSKSENIKKFLAYAVSKRAINLHNDRGIFSGININDAKYVVEKYETPEFKKAAEEITKWSNQLLDWVFEAGEFDEATRQIIRDGNPIYLPFKRLLIDRADIFQKQSGGGNVLKKIRGSDKPIINPLESLVNMAVSYVRAANKMRVVNAIVKPIEGMGFLVDEIATPVKPIRLKAETIVEAMKAAGILNDIETEAMLDIDDKVLTFFQATLGASNLPNVVTVWRNGKPKFYELNPELYKALQNVSDFKIGAALKVLGVFARAKRLGATGINPSFTLYFNLVRDFLMSSITSRRSFATPLDPFAGMFKDIFAKKGSLAWRQKAVGAEMATMMGFDRNATMKLLDLMLLESEGFKGKILKVAKHPIMTIRNLFQISEMGARIVEMEGMIKKYIKENPKWSYEDAFIKAFNDAQDVTINFTKSGTTGKQINQGVAFFNAAMQGIVKLYSSAKENPIRFIVRGIVFISLPALYFWNKNRKKKWYKNLPPAYKYNNLFIETTDGDTPVIVRVPLPFEVGQIFGGSLMATLDYMAEKDPKAMEGLMDNVYGNFTPSLLPDMLQPWYDVATNKNWLGQAIETEGMKTLPKEHRYYDYSTNISKMLSSAMSDISKTGMGKVLTIDDKVLSPLQIDYILNSYTGGIYQRVARSIDALKDSRDYDINDLPIIGRIFLRKPEKPTRLINDFYIRKEYLDEQYNVGEITISEIVERDMYGIIYERSLKPYNQDVKRFTLEKNKSELSRIYNEIADKLLLANRAIYNNDYVVDFRATDKPEQFINIFKAEAKK